GRPRVRRPRHGDLAGLAPVRDDRALRGRPRWVRPGALHRADPELPRTAGDDRHLPRPPEADEEAIRPLTEVRPEPGEEQLGPPGDRESGGGHAEAVPASLEEVLLDGVAGGAPGGVQVERSV